MLLVSTLVSRLLLILVEMASFIRLRIITPAVTVLIRSSHWDCSPVDYDLEKPIFFFFLLPLAHLFDYLYAAPGAPWIQRKRRIPEHGKTCPYASLWMLSCCFTTVCVWWKPLPDLSSQGIGVPTSASPTGSSMNATNLFTQIIAIVTTAWTSTK